MVRERADTLILLELVVNLKTAKQLGISLSRDFLGRVDHVIQD